ncbi:MAG: DUF1295 domain-containing protein [Tenericutes bacterium]|nr:DUF1295 domain-containing protein [Mycoplasmatota bacterium]
MNLDKLSKKQTGIIFIIVYGLTILVGTIIVFFGARYGRNILVTMLIADIVMTVIIFIIGSVIKNASLYDPYWSIMPFYILIIWLLLIQGFSFSLNAILLLFVVGLWSIRLTYNWWKNWTGFAHQDWRYDMLKNKNPKVYPLTNFVGIHMIPTIVVFLQMVCVLEIIQYTTINMVFYIGLLVSLMAPFLQHIADKQMYDFRLNNKSKNRVINSGIWRFTRHPNYLGELLLWIGIYVMYLSYAKEINYYVLFPISMILLFVLISIPMMEKKLEDRPGFYQYKKSVSILIPFPPKKAENEDEILD